MKTDIVKLHIEDLFDQIEPDECYEFIKFEVDEPAGKEVYESVDIESLTSYSRLSMPEYKRIVMLHIEYNKQLTINALNGLLVDLESTSQGMMRDYVHAGLLVADGDYLKKYYDKPLVWGATHNNSVSKTTIILLVAISKKC